MPPRASPKYIQVWYFACTLPPHTHNVQKQINFRCYMQSPSELFQPRRAELCTANLFSSSLMVYSLGGHGNVRYHTRRQRCGLVVLIIHERKSKRIHMHMYRTNTNNPRHRTRKPTLESARKRTSRRSPCPRTPRTPPQSTPRPCRTPPRRCRTPGGAGRSPASQGQTVSKQTAEKGKRKRRNDLGRITFSTLRSSFARRSKRGGGWVVCG